MLGKAIIGFGGIANGHLRPVWSLNLLLAITSTVILGFGTHGIHHHTFLPHDSDRVCSSSLLLAFAGSVMFGFGPYQDP
jgi:hypothetical protein